MNFSIIICCGDFFLFKIFILFFFSLFALLYFVFRDKTIKSNHPLVYQFIIISLFLVLGLTFLFLLIFLFNFYYILLSKAYYYLKYFLVKILSSDKSNANTSASQESGSGSGGNPNKNNNNNNNNNSNYDFKTVNNKKDKKETYSQPRTPKELRDSNKEIDNLNQNLRGYTKKLKELKNQHDINYSLDSAGNLSIDVPATMSDTQAADLSRRVGVIDRLYNTQQETFKSVSNSALAKTEEFKRSSGTEPYTSSFLESQIHYNEFVKDEYKGLFR
jgi:hypothetical protein